RASTHAPGAYGLIANGVMNAGGLPSFGTHASPHWPGGHAIARPGSGKPSNLKLPAASVCAARNDGYVQLGTWPSPGTLHQPIWTSVSDWNSRPTRVTFCSGL